MSEVASYISGMGNLFGNILGVMSQENTNNMNAMIARYSYDQQRQMIREQNEYNSPVNQMARYKAAGLNPNLIYGQIDGGNQGEIAKYQGPTYRPLEFGNIGQSLMDAIRLNLESKQVQADIHLKEEQAYAQKMVGLGYQQDYYRKLMDNAVQSEIVGYNPGLIMSNDELQAVRGSKALARYDAESRKIDYGNVLTQAQTALAHVSAREKQNIIDNLMPLQQKLLFLQVEGKSIENAILEIDRATEYLYRMANTNSNFWRALTTTSTLVFGDTKFGRYVQDRIRGAEAKALGNGNRRRSGTR